MNVKTEPISLIAAVTAAATATINFLAIVLNWSNDVTAALNLVIGAWIGVAGAWQRSQVTPNSRVALTTDDVALIEAGKAEASGP